VQSLCGSPRRKAGEGEINFGLAPADDKRDAPARPAAVRPAQRAVSGVQI